MRAPPACSKRRVGGALAVALSVLLGALPVGALAFGVPPMPPRRSVYSGLWVIVVIFSLAFPMSGLAILVMIAFDQIVVRFVPPLKRVFA